MMETYLLLYIRFHLFSHGCRICLLCIAFRLRHQRRYQDDGQTAKTANTNVAIRSRRMSRRLSRPAPPSPSQLPLSPTPTHQRNPPPHPPVHPTLHLLLRIDREFPIPKPDLPIPAGYGNDLEDIDKRHLSDQPALLAGDAAGTERSNPKCGADAID